MFPKLSKLLNPMPLHLELKNNLGIPIESIVIGNPDDRSTWYIVFGKDTTEEQKKTAQTMLKAYEPPEVEFTFDDKIKSFESRILALEEDKK